MIDENTIWELNSFLLGYEHKYEYEYEYECEYECEYEYEMMSYLFQLTLREHICGQKKLARQCSAKETIENDTKSGWEF